ncbi:MAG TPA: sulfatase [Beijerinckiaceae bacterium]|nr:sulfatase [Beijerinckiaceae bacterium]
MSDISFESSPIRSQASRDTWRAWPARHGIPARWAWSIVTIIAVVLAFNYVRTEGRWPTQLIAFGGTISFAALLAFATRRVLFATFLTVAIIVTIKLAAIAKLQTMNMVLHAYDLVFYLSDWPTVKYLLTEFSDQFLLLAFVLLTVAGLGWVIFRADPTRARRSLSAAVAVAAFAVSVAGVIAMGERRHQQFEYQGQFISSFLISWQETLETLWKGQLIDAAHAAAGPPLAPLERCNTAFKPPHIILIHQESVFPPSVFANLNYDRSMDPFFRSHDGQLHKLRVETYGGASNLTEFSILTGLSTRSFGGMRQFLQTVMAGKIREALPHVLERCGYRNVMFYPMLKNFAQTGRFFEGVGLTDIRDKRGQNAPTFNERDAFYYRSALDEMERHFAQSRQPLFTFIETMSAHWPFNFTYAPEMEVPGGLEGTHPEMHEFLRRVSIAKIDYDKLKKELARRFPSERFLVVMYGDHQPMSTRMLLNFAENSDSEDVVIPPDSIGFHTFYAVNGVNYAPPPLPRHELVDVAYLSTLLLESARLPLPDSYRERRRLLDVCKGRYSDCVHQQEVLAFHRRLIDANLMQAR